ncbi:MAG: uridine kinase, partial [Fusobacteriales bacterium]
MEKIVIGIAGGTGSGKTSISNMIVEDLKKYGCNLVLLEQDSYYKDNRELDFESRTKLNYDHPDSIDFELLIDHVKKLKDGVNIDKPIYDFTTHLRTEEKEVLEAQDIIIVEGILLYAVEELRDLFDVKIFVDTDDDI